MARFALWFEGKSSPELCRTEFFHSLSGETLRCVRGKRSGPYKDFGTFQWTNAVKALSVLCLKARCFKCERGILTGQKGSLAASLDYAIDKQPNWLIDMLGVDSRGQALVSRLMNRSNPGQRKGRRVCLAINQNTLKPDEIIIYLNGELLSEDDDLQSLLNSLSCHCNSSDVHVTGCDAASQPLTEAEAFAKFRNEYEDETGSVLKYDAVFSECQWQQQLKDAVQQGSVEWVAGKSINYLLEMLRPIEAELLGILRIGTEEKEFLEGSFTVFCSPILAGSLTLLNYLRYRKHINLDLHSGFSQTVNMISRIEEAEILPDMFTASIASAARFTNLPVSEEYIPLMIMPSFSHAVIHSKKAGTESRYKKYHFCCSHPATPNFVFRDLQKTGTVRAGDEFSHLETRLLTERLRQDDDGIVAIRTFPYFNANILFDECKSVTDTGVSRYKHSVLFGKKERFSTDMRIRAMRSLIYDAWNVLRVNSLHRTEILSETFSDITFQKSLLRFTGVDDLLEDISGDKK